ncbi:MAG: TatD family nuclease-associated radical SAM protein [Oscillospiraceae bacterium]|jgi:TatD family-associated radical SAM protein|nr:TatD family nuclease-associated radical SAM protein [Oscillospiraceae bacterium]
MTITYRVGGGLYVNLTNRCGNRCDFCVRTFSDAVGDAPTLWLPREPTRAEVWESIAARDMTACRELVFCGYGEPTERLDDLLWVCARTREAYPGLPIRINTNGQANLICGADVTPRLRGLADTVSVSLNYPDAARYEAHCRPAYEGAFEAILTFARLTAAQALTVVMTVVDLLPAADIERCRALAASCGAALRVRPAMLPENGGAAG